MLKKPILEALASMPHSVEAKGKFSPGYVPLWTNWTVVPMSTLMRPWLLRNTVSLVIRVNLERARVDQQPPKAGPSAPKASPSVIMGRQSPQGRPI